MAQYSDEVIVFVVVTLFTWVTVARGGMAQYLDDMIALVEVKVIVPRGYAPYVGGGALYPEDVVVVLGFPYPPPSVCAWGGCWVSSEPRYVSLLYV